MSKNTSTKYKVSDITANHISGTARTRGARLRKAQRHGGRGDDRDDVLDAGALDNATIRAQGNNVELVILRKSQRFGGEQHKKRQRA